MRTVAFMGKACLLIVALVCAAWLVITIHLFVVHGLFESLTFALGSIYLLVLVFSVIYHDRP